MSRPPAPDLVRRALARQAFADVTDATLLVRFTRHRDNDAFAELVRRYSPLVWGACRRACSDTHIAEDAFQATFAALARQAGSVRRAECLPGWLHGVARRTANRLRTRAARHPSAELPDLPAGAPSPLDQASGRELIEAVDAEVARLPAKYRSAVLACWFEDASLDEAARRLGVSRGVLWGRLKRGRERLRRRLAARGFALPAVLAIAALTDSPAPARLTDRAVEAALRGGEGPAMAPAVGTATLLKVGGGLGLAAAVVFGLTTLFPGKVPDPPQDPPKPPPAPAAERIDDGFPMPAGAVHRFGNRQLRHPEGIFASAVSPDGKLLATASNAVVVVWDLKTLAARRVFTGFRFNNYGSGDRGGHLTFLPDSTGLLVIVRPDNAPGKRVAGPHETLAEVWDVDTGKLRYPLKGVWNYNSAAWVAAGGKEVAVLMHDQDGTPGSAIRYHDVKTGKDLRTVQIPHLDSGPWVAPDGDTIAIQGPNGNGLIVLDAKTGKEWHTFPDVQVARAALGPDGKVVAWTDAGGKVRGYDREGKKELFAFDHPEPKKPGPMAFAPDGKTLFFTSDHGRLFRWDVAGNQMGPAFGNRHNFWNLSGIVPSPDGAMVYTVSHDKLVKRWDLKTGQEILPPEGYTTRTTLTMAVDGKHLILSDHEGQVDYWDLATGRRVKQLQPAHLGGINCLAQSADGQWLAAGRTSQDVRLFDLTTGKVVRDMYLGDNSDAKWGDQAHRVAFDSAGRVAFSSSEKTGVTAWDVATGKKLWNTPDAGPYLAVDPLGRWVAAGGGYRDGSVYWTALDAKTGDLRARVVPAGEEGKGRTDFMQLHPLVTDLAFLPDGSRLVTVHGDGTVRTWDVEARREARRFRVTTGPALCLSLTPDGRWLAVGSREGVGVWELATGKRLAAFAGHHSEVTQVAFTRDGRGLISNADLAPVLWALAPKDLPAVDGLPYLLWEALAAEDAEKAYRVQWALAKKPDVAVKLFREQVKPAELAASREQFDKWVGALDSPQFRVREAAEKDLSAAAGRVPVAWLRAALADARSDEVRARLGRVLARREKEPDPTGWRLGRAVQVLELAGTPEAKELLKAWAAEDSPLAADAKAALGRLQP